MADKKDTRLCPFNEPYHIPVQEFCDKMKLNKILVMKRMNSMKGFWEDCDAILIPEYCGGATTDKIQRALKLISYGWNDSQIANRLSLTLSEIAGIKKLNNYQKEIFASGPEKTSLLNINIDIDKWFGGDEK